LHHWLLIHGKRSLARPIPPFRTSPTTFKKYFLNHILGRDCRKTSSNSTLNELSKYTNS
jgi:hypothetical protein